MQKFNSSWGNASKFTNEIINVLKDATGMDVWLPCSGVINTSNPLKNQHGETPEVGISEPFWDSRVTQGYSTFLAKIPAKKR